MTEGYLDTVKSAVITHISEADATLSPKATHVLGNLDEDVWKYDTNNFPIVTVRFGTSVDRELIQGRQLGGASTKKVGNFVSFFFTLNVYTAINDTTGEDNSKTAMDLAEAIKEHLLRSDDATSGIMYYSEVTTRETSSGMATVAKVIIEGFVFARRPFNI